MGQLLSCLSLQGSFLVFPVDLSNSFLEQLFDFLLLFLYLFLFRSLFYIHLCLKFLKLGLKSFVFLNLNFVFGIFLYVGRKLLGFLCTFLFDLANKVLFLAELQVHLQPFVVELVDFCLFGLFDLFLLLLKLLKHQLLCLLKFLSLFEEHFFLPLSFGASGLFLGYFEPFLDLGLIFSDFFVIFIFADQVTETLNKGSLFILLLNMLIVHIWVGS